VKSGDSWSDHGGRTRARHASICDSVAGTCAGCEGSRPTVMPFLPCQLPEEQSLWLHHRAGGCVPARTQKPAAKPSAGAGLPPASVPVSRAYGSARVGPLRLQPAVDRKLRSAVGVSASWWSWSEVFSFPGRGWRFSFDRCVRGSGGRRPYETTDGAASTQLPYEGRWSQTALTDRGNACEIKDVADAYAQLSNVFGESWAPVHGQNTDSRPLSRLCLALGTANFPSIRD